MTKWLNRWRIWLILYLCYLMILTLIPFDFSIDRFKQSGRPGLSAMAYENPAWWKKSGFENSHDRGNAQFFD